MIRRYRSKPGLPIRLLETALWLCGLLCAAMLGSARMEARSAQGSAMHIANGVGSAAPDLSRPSDEVIGRLEIHELGLSVPVMRNYDAASLVRGVGHIPGTAVPGGLGNLVLAGHRDTYFRPLRRIKRGMTMQMVDSRGRWNYRVDRMEVVTPDQVRVLDIGDRPEMTLITCYPFEFIGSAPRRFIVHAHLLSADAEE